MRQSEPWHNNKKPWSLLECKDILGSSKPPMLKKGGEGMCRTCSVCGKTEKDTRIIKKVIHIIVESITYSFIDMVKF